MTPTQGEHAQPEALRLADWLQNAVSTYPQVSEDEPGGYCQEVDQVMDEAAAQLRRLHAQVAALTAAPQGGAYAELPEHLTLAVDRWFAENTGLGGCSDKDVRELAALFYGVHHAGGREHEDLRPGGREIGDGSDVGCHTVLLVPALTACWS